MLDLVCWYTIFLVSRNWKRCLVHSSLIPVIHVQINPDGVHWWWAQCWRACSASSYSLCHTTTITLVQRLCGRPALEVVLLGWRRRGVRTITRLSPCFRQTCTPRGGGCGVAWCRDQSSLIRSTTKKREKQNKNCSTHWRSNWTNRQAMKGTTTTMVDDIDLA